MYVNAVKKISNCKQNNLYTTISLVKLFIDSLSLFNVTKVVNSPRKCVTQLGFPDHIHILSVKKILNSNILRRNVTIPRDGGLRGGKCQPKTKSINPFSSLRPEWNLIKLHSVHFQCHSTT